LRRWPGARVEAEKAAQANVIRRVTTGTIHTA
jgi:hypothetical protein